jgi:hypothetical protein
MATTSQEHTDSDTFQDELLGSNEGIKVAVKYNQAIFLFNSLLESYCF